MPSSKPHITSLSCIDVLGQDARKEYYSLGGLNNKHSFLTVLKAEKSKIKVLEDLVSGEGILPDLQMIIFL